MVSFLVSHHFSAPTNPHQPAPPGENGEADWVQLGDKSHEQGPRGPASSHSWLAAKWLAGFWWFIQITLWLFNIAMENGPFTDGLPIKNGDFPWLC